MHNRPSSKAATSADDHPTATYSSTSDCMPRLVAPSWRRRDLVASTPGPTALPRRLWRGPESLVSSGSPPTSVIHRASKRPPDHPRGRRGPARIHRPSRSRGTDPGCGHWARTGTGTGRGAPGRSSAAAPAGRGRAGTPRRSERRGGHRAAVTGVLRIRPAAGDRGGRGTARDARAEPFAERGTRRARSDRGRTAARRPRRRRAGDRRSPGRPPGAVAAPRNRPSSSLTRDRGRPSPPTPAFLRRSRRGWSR
jgi:hypothetical protein